MPPRPSRLPALLLLTALALSACLPGTPTPALTATTSSPSLVVTTTRGPTPTASLTSPAPISVDASALRGVELQAWQAFSGAAADVFAGQVAGFNAGNEWGIVVTSSSYGDYPTLFDAVNTALAGGSGPDLVAALPEQTLAWNASASVVDLNPYLADASWGLGSAAQADIPPVFWLQDKYNGMQLGVPAQRSAHFIYYNKTWAHQLGFNSPPASLDEFRQQACAANASFKTDASPQNDGYGGWIVDTSWQTTYSWLLASGGSVVSGNAYTFRTDPNLAALQYVKGLYDDHCAWLSTDPTPFDAFAGRLALFVSGDLSELPLAAESISRLHNTDDWTLIPFPGAEGGTLVAYGPSYSLLKSTPEKSLAAWLFIRWLLAPAQQADWVRQTGSFPLGSSVLDQVSAFRSASPQWDAAVGYLPLAQGVPQLASWRTVRYVLEDGLTVVFQMDAPLAQLPAVLTEMDSQAGELNK